MKLDLYQNARTAKVTREVDLEEFTQCTESPFVADCIAKYRSGDADAKRKLPAVTFMGKSRTGKRAAADMDPTGLVMIDIDHADDKLSALLERVLSQDFLLGDADPVLIHITPSGKGLRIVCRMGAGDNSILTAIHRIATTYNLDEFGEIDLACKDLSRLSFLPQASDIKFINGHGLFNAEPPATFSEDTAEGPNEDTGDQNDTAPYADFKYGEIPVAEIADEYVKWKGEPTEGTTHNFYNSMILDFRNICNNSPQILVDVLPRFGQTRAERYRQCESLCKRHTSVKLPQAFYYFLKDRGYYVDSREELIDDTTEAPDPYAEEYALLDRMPKLPPVFREIINSAPREFKIPALVSLLPIMGTLTTYLQAEYFDGEMQTTSFMSLLLAPPSSGKSFVNRFLNIDYETDRPTNLLHELVRRDHVTQARVNLWLAFSNTKKDSEKGKIRPKTTTRIMPAIFSQADFLPVMKDNQGMHLFTFAPEIDTFLKGMKAGGGGDKSDIIRIAWDNGVYGQSFRGTNSFRGKVALYYNVLTTGTPAQCAKMFTDIENGLLTRCSFTDLGQQEFAKYQPWKKLSSKDLQVIANFRNRCEAGTYDRPLVFDLSTIDDYTDEETFDKDVPWEFRFRGRETIDLTYMHKPLLDWLEAQRILAEKDADNARDVFRKRSAVKAFRLALLCHALWNNVSKKEQAIIKDFCLWFADLDLMKICKHFGSEYNDFRAKFEQKQTAKAGTKFATLFDTLPTDFTKGDVKVAAAKSGAKTAIRAIISVWKKAGIIKKTETGWTKTKK